MIALPEIADVLPTRSPFRCTCERNGQGWEIYYQDRELWAYCRGCTRGHQLTKMSYLESLR